MSNIHLLDRPVRRVGFLFVAAALLAASCGADGASSDATTTTITTTSTTEVPSVTTSDTSGAAESPDSGSDDITEPGDTTPTLVPSTDPTKVQPADPAVPSGIVDPVLEPLYTRAVADLAVRLGVDAGAITVVHAEMVVWPDSSRGCPQPGMAYLQVLTDGVWIVLSHEGTSYTYVTAADGTVFLCETTIKQRPVEGAPPGFGDS